MSDSSAAASSKSKEAGAKNQKQPLLDSRRRSELLGFLVAVAGLLVLLSLASYLPEDPSLNTSAAPGAATLNWVGPVGAYSADLLFQALGWVAYLIPMLLLVVGSRLLLVRPFATPKTKAAGAMLLVASLSALLELFPFTPAVRGLIRGSGMLGYLAAAGLVQTFNHVGAAIVAATVFLSSLFLVTRFSFSWAATFLKARWQSIARPIAARWQKWQEARAEAAEEQRRRRAEEMRSRRKPPIVIGKPVLSPATRLVTPPEPAAPQVAAAEEAVAEPADPHEAPDLEVDIPIAAQAGRTDRGRKGEEETAPLPKIVGRETRAYKYPSPALLRPPDDSEGIDEDELKDRAARLYDLAADVFDDQEDKDVYAVTPLQKSE